MRIGESSSKISYPKCSKTQGQPLCKHPCNNLWGMLLYVLMELPMGQKCIILCDIFNNRQMKRSKHAPAKSNRHTQDMVWWIASEDRRHQLAWYVVSTDLSPARGTIHWYQLRYESAVKVGIQRKTWNTTLYVIRSNLKASSFLVGVSKQSNTPPSQHHINNQRAEDTMGKYG